MRRTVDLAPDVERAVATLRAETGVTLSQAVNELIRRGQESHPTVAPFRQRTRDLGLRIDVSSTSSALESLTALDTP